MAAVKVKGYKVLEPVKHDGELLAIGDQIREDAIEEKDAEGLVALQAIEPAEWLDEVEESGEAKPADKPRSNRRQSENPAGKPEDKAADEAKDKSADNQE